MEDIVLYENEGKIGKITLNKPEQRNTIDLQVLKRLIKAFKESANNEDVCVIYSANGKHFTVGADLKYGYALLSDKSRLDETVEFLESWQILTRTMLAHPGIIIAGLHGWVIGGGFEHTLACDLRIAANDTRIMLPEVGIGLFFSNASTKLLPRIIGEARAKELMILGNEISTEEALRIGLVNQVCKPEGLKRNLKKMANKIVSRDHLALKYTKTFINENQDLSIESVLARESIAMNTTGQSEELRKRLERFVKGRQ
ncbi:MAG: enoyl-CoA hydratase/isomerase family protein [Candidatus Lokiarchaeota archaeon]|nr:enoyl-CoA hydratase/isomerase family protein [Candidatus Lokiarchaeota archaeon]